jgi:hypothetical protein
VKRAWDDTQERVSDVYINWFSKGLWKWLIHYSSIVLDIYRCVMYTHNILGVGFTSFL